MKPSSLILPLIALALVSAMIGSQRRSIAASETECARLEKHITGVESRTPATATPHDPLGKRKQLIEWGRIATHFPSNPSLSSGTFSFGALPDERVRLRFQQRMGAMTPDETIALLDEIAALNLPEKTFEDLQWTLLDSLARKDPERALKLIAERDLIDTLQFGSLIPNAISAWARNDSVAAAAWVDQLIDAGTFESKRLDGVNYTRQNLESALLGPLLTSFPEEAARRLTALPEDQRGSVLQTYFQYNQFGDDQLTANAELIRAYVPLEDQAQMIGSQAAQLFEPGDFSAVTTFLDRIDAKPAERAAFALRSLDQIYPEEGSRYLSRENIDGLREWVVSQLPDSNATVMGEILAQAAWADRKMDFNGAAELALEYNAAGGNDELLAAFLTSHAAHRNKAAARSLAETISNEQRRAEVLTYLK